MTAASARIDKTLYESTFVNTTNQRVAHVMATGALDLVMPILYFYLT